MTSGMTSHCNATANEIQYAGNIRLSSLCHESVWYGPKTVLVHLAPEMQLFTRCFGEVII